MQARDVHLCPIKSQSSSHIFNSLKSGLSPQKLHHVIPFIHEKHVLHILPELTDHHALNAGGATCGSLEVLQGEGPESKEKKVRL